MTATIVAGLLMMVGLVGIVVPVLPGLLLTVGATAVWAMAHPSPAAWVVFWIALALYVVGVVTQYLLPGRRMRRDGVGTLTMAAAVVLTRRASRHEVLAIDPLRLGPVASVLDRARIVPIGADVPAVDTGRWRLDKHGATLEIGLLPDSTAAYPAMDFMDGVWRFHLRVVAAQARSCRTARLKLEHPADARDWPKPNLGIVADGQWHTYAIHGNHDLRPMHPGRLWISFDCPPGTEITWGAGELLRSTMPQAAHALWVEGKAIDPYTPLPWPTHPQ